jgi:acetyltransferase-like isoleucine patch superfamily enzyme
MLKYFFGFLCHFFHKGVSSFSLVDNISMIHKKAKINYGVKIYDSKIGAYTYIGPKSEIVSADVGKFCSIAQNCYIGLASHSIKNISTSPIFTSKKNGTGHTWTDHNYFTETSRVIIGNDVWIGVHVTIIGGIKIGNGAIIGTGSIVTKDIPDYAVAAGVPAKVIKYRFENNIVEKLLQLKWWELPEELLRKNIEIFQKENFNPDDLIYLLRESETIK